VLGVNQQQSASGICESISDKTFRCPGGQPSVIVRKNGALWFLYLAGTPESRGINQPVPIYLHGGRAKKKPLVEGL
jgi:hypothetical protein